jgi:hypothetical protein
MKHKVSELEGDLLDAAVALADGRLVVKDEPGWQKGDYRAMREEWSGEHVVRWYAHSDPAEIGGWEPLGNQGCPSTDWNIGGPIIERERIVLMLWPSRGFTWAGQVWGYATPMQGDTALIAAMRAFVHSRLGDEVKLP